MNKDAYWFRHDSNAKDDPKCIILIEELGLEGYGIFWVLVETLRDQKDFKAPLRIIPAIARRYNTSSEKIKAVITRYELFQIENDKFFFSPSLIQRMQDLLQKKHDKRIGGIKGNLIKYGHATKEELNELTDEEILRLNEEKTGFSHSDRTPIALEERREDKIIEDNTHARVPDLENVISYFNEKGFPKSLAEKFYNYYNEPMQDRNGRVWKDQNGKTVKSWKQKALAVWMKEENKKNEERVFDGGTW